MTYKKQFLQQLTSHDRFGSKEHAQVTQDLIMQIQEGINITLAEEEFVCRALKNSGTNDPSYNITHGDFDGCCNYLFKNIYLSYFKDLNGNGKIYDFKGEILSNQKYKDCAFLEKEYDK